MSNIDKSLHFGIQNFFIVEVDETDGTYNYYGYENKKGSILIMRTNKAVTSIKYYVAIGTFSTIWAGKSGYTYQYPSQLVDQSY